MAVLIIDRATLDVLFSRYEEARLRFGQGSEFHHVTPRQRVDALEICVAVYASGAAPGPYEPKQWLRYLTPVLAETRDAARALEAAFETLLTAPTEPSCPSSPDPMSRARAWLNSHQTFAALVSAGISLAFTAALAVILIDRLIDKSDFDKPIRDPSPPIVTPNPAPAPTPTGEASSDRYIEALNLTLSAARQRNYDITPRELAQNYAAYMNRAGGPAALLVEMLRYSPAARADQNIPRSQEGLNMLRRFAALAAALQYDLYPIHVIETSLVIPDARAGEDVAKAANEFGSPPDGFRTTSRAIARPSTPGWIMWLPLLVFLPGAAWAFRGLRSSIEDAREAAMAAPSPRSAHSNETGKAAIWRTSPVLLPDPPYAGAAARRLGALQERRPGFVFDAPRSLRATLAAHGEFVALMLPASRRVDLVFLVNRRHPNDQERARVLRDLDALRAAGAPLFAYDYGPDLRTIQTVDGARSFDLRGLRELHAGALLVVVTDGQDLVDPFSQRSLPIVSREMALWPRRMILSTVGLRDWGEREFQIARAFEGPIGRATMKGLGDLALGLSANESDSHASVALRNVRGETYFERIDDWVRRAAAPIASDLTPRLPPLLRRDNAALLLDPGPPSIPSDNPAEFTVSGLVAALWKWLGPRGFFWFAACAAYPQLRFDITLWLGGRLRAANRPLFEERLLAQLCVLPWFRVGRMPEWLRLAAFEALGEAQQKEARAAIDELLHGENHVLGHVRALVEGLPDGVRARAMVVLDETMNGATDNLEWLFAVALKGCAPAEAARAREDIEAYLRTRRLPLPVWYPDSSGRAMTPDDVMIEIKNPSDTRPNILQDARTKAIERWAFRGVARMMGLAVWAATMAAFIPRPADAPHSAGAWWPALIFAISSLIVVVLLTLLSVGRARERADWRMRSAGGA